MKKRNNSAKFAGASLAVFALSFGIWVNFRGNMENVASAVAAPADPKVLFAEDFENVDGAKIVDLTDYIGESGMTYMADPFYLETRNCNGFIVSQDATVDNIDQAKYCLGVSGNFNSTDFARVILKAKLLGELTNNSENHALSTNTGNNYYDDVSHNESGGENLLMLGFAKI